MKTRNRWGWALLAVAAACVAVLFWASSYMLSYSLQPENNDGRNYPASYRRVTNGLPATKLWIDSLRRVHALRDTFMTRGDGVRLHALMVPARRPTGRTAVLVHGYTDNAVSMLHIGYMYHHELGFNLLLPDLYGHGKSGGDMAQMGWNDADDVAQWVRMANGCFADSTGQSAIVVHGVSMGAATTMTLSGRNDLNAVKCFVEDCGYTSVWDEFAVQLDQQFGLPECPLMYTSSLLCKLRYGWSFGEASMIDRVARCRKPMLFIHGSRDTFVPTSMVYRLYAAKPAPKQLYVCPGAGHAGSYRKDAGGYTRQVAAFVSKWM